MLSERMRENIAANPHFDSNFLQELMGIWIDEVAQLEARVAELENMPILAAKEVVRLEAENQQLRDLLQVSEELVGYLNEQLPPEKRMKKALENAT
jgi:hypothetical protein